MLNLKGAHFKLVTTGFFVYLVVGVLSLRSLRGYMYALKRFFVGLRILRSSLYLYIMCVDVCICVYVYIYMHRARFCGKENMVFFRYVAPTTHTYIYIYIYMCVCNFFSLLLVQ